MSTRSTLRSYDYVNRPVASVIEALRRDAFGIFSRATHHARAREHSLGLQLGLELGALHVATDVQLQLGPAQTAQEASTPHQTTAFPLSWQSAVRPSLFPHMTGQLLVYPLSATETQLEFEGSYEPPLGLFGDAFDAVVGRRIADACVLRLVQDIAAQLRLELEQAS